jgi:hypothetical protein
MNFLVNLFCGFVIYAVFDACIWPEPSIIPGIFPIPCDTTSLGLITHLLTGSIPDRDRPCFAMWMNRWLLIAYSCLSFYGISHLINVILTPLYVHLIQNEVPAGAG